VFRIVRTPTHCSVSEIGNTVSLLKEWKNDEKILVRKDASMCRWHPEIKLSENKLQLDSENSIGWIWCIKCDPNPEFTV
jgi:hypothetical protein